jgi:transposase-like protein
MVEETFEPGTTVSLVARRHGVGPNQLFTWRRLVAQGAAFGRWQQGGVFSAPTEVRRY